MLLTATAGNGPTSKKKLKSQKKKKRKKCEEVEEEEKEEELPSVKDTVCSNTEGIRADRAGTEHQQKLKTKQTGTHHSNKRYSQPTQNYD